MNPEAVDILRAGRCEIVFTNEQGERVLVLELTKEEAWMLAELIRDKLRFNTDAKKV